MNRQTERQRDRERDRQTDRRQWRIQAVFEIGNHFWMHENRRPNFDRSTEDMILILFNSR